MSISTHNLMVIVSSRLKTHSVKNNQKNMRKILFQADIVKKNWKILLSCIDRLDRNVCIFVSFKWSDIRESQFDIWKQARFRKSIFAL